MSKRFLVIKKHDLVYARVPKVANSSIKTALSQLVHTERLDNLKPTNDRFWKTCTFGETDMLEPEEYTDEYHRFFSFSFVREPVDRLFSCYVNKILVDKCAQAFVSRGYKPGMTFDDFVRRTCSLDIEKMDVHTQPQEYLISDLEGRLPSFIGTYENLTTSWSNLVQQCAERGIQLPDELPMKNNRKKAREGVSNQLSQEAREELERVFRKDFDLHANLNDAQAGG